MWVNYVRPLLGDVRTCLRCYVHTNNQEELPSAQRQNKPPRSEYYLNNKDAIKERTKQYYLNNKEAIKERKKSYYLARKAAIKQYMVEHKEEIKEKKKEYYRNNKGAILEKRARKKEAMRRARRGHYLKHKEEILLYKKEYYLRNREVLRLSHLKNREAVLVVQKRYRERNKDALKEKKRLYRMKNKKARKGRSWGDPESVREFFERARELLYVRDPEDWYRISRVQIGRVGGASVYSIFGSLGKALQYAFPGVLWEEQKFSLRGKKSTQRWLKVILQQILPPDSTIYEDFLHPSLFWDEEGAHRMELDIWVPKYQIAVEYQGEHHYHDLYFAYGPSGTLSMYAARDMKKKESCASNGISLVTVPYWWDGTKESLAASLFKIRPDIFPHTPYPQIPLFPPGDTPIKGDTILKENHIASLLMHGKVWSDQDPTGWFISEKLDGFRAVWDGQKLCSRRGNELPVPEEFTQHFPRDVVLDGELWTGYGDFSKLSSILKTSLEDVSKVLELWKDVKFCVFDAPKHTGYYLERHSFATQLMSGPHMNIVPIVQCLGLDHLKAELELITNKRGEGLMLYHPSSTYTSGRTYNLLKVKASLEEDVKFIKINPNSYSFLCEQKNGVECIVKCSGWDYSFPPMQGTVLTVKHNGYFESSTKLKYPFLLRVRNDLDWNQMNLKDQK